MDLNAVRAMLRQSVPADWNLMDAAGVLAEKAVPNCGEVIVEAVEFGYVGAAVYAADLDLAIRYGAAVAFEDRHLPRAEWNTYAWSSVFNEPAVTECVADVLWRGSVVDRVRYAIVDRGAAVLPWIEDNKRETAAHLVAVARLIHSFQEFHGDFDRYMHMAGITVG